MIFLFEIRCSTLKQFVNEIQEIMPLRTCVSYFFTFPKKIYGVSVIRFALKKLSK